MSAIDDYKKRVNSSMRDSMINSSKSRITNNIKNSPSYYNVTLERPLFSDQQIDVQIVDDSQTKDEKIVTTLYETPLSLGNIITWKGSKWIVVHFDEMSEIYKRGRIRKCLTTIKWLDADGFVKEADFTLTATASTNFGIQDGRIVDLGAERRQLFIQANADTSKIAKTKRFIFDNRAWKVTGLDGLTADIINLTVEEDQINPAADNVEERIADYVGNVGSYAITILGGETFSVQPNQTLQLNAEVTRNGTAVTDQPVTWSVSEPSIATIDQAGFLTSIANGTVNVSAALSNDSSIVDTASVTVETVVIDTYTINITNTSSAPNEIKKGQSKTYNAEIYKNGLLITDGSQLVTFSLWDDTQTTSTTYASITSSTGSSCVVKNNDDGIDNVFVQIRATLSSDNTVITWKRIQMIPLF